MENLITKNVSFTFTKEQFEYFAQKKGWTKTITQDDGTEIDNPVLAEDFIVPLLMSDFVAMISTPWVLDIADGYEQAKQAAIKQAQEQLSQGINVTE